MPTAGQLRERVRFERRAKGGNVGGVVRTDWRKFAGPFRAGLKPVRGGEEALGARLSGRDVFELTVRGCKALRDLQTSDRAVDDRNPARSFNILNIQNPDQKGEWLVILVERGAIDG